MSRYRLVRTLAIATALLFFCTLSQAQSSGSGKSGSGAASSGASGSSSGLVDINTATKEQLTALPGISDADAQKIIDGRPYRTKNDLAKRKIIPQADYDKIGGMVVATPTKRPGNVGKPQ